MILFWDYDTQWGADRSRTLGGPKSWGLREFENTERLLEVHREWEISACFAVVGAAALPGPRPYHDPEQIRCVHEAGHEIASHSLRHDWLPGLTRKALLEDLRASKDALEQCISAQVVSFVPPYNQPWDYPAGWSLSLSERREAGRNRIGLRELCDCLRETGYRFCRVAYRSLCRRLTDCLAGHRLDGPVQLRRIAGVSCLRLNTGCGFGADVSARMQGQTNGRGYWVLYGHPHSVSTPGSPQNLDCLLATLSFLKARRSNMRFALPRELVAGSDVSGIKFAGTRL